jgi:hypothetical protein
MALSLSRPCAQAPARRYFVRTGGQERNSDRDTRFRLAVVCSEPNKKVPDLAFRQALVMDRLRRRLQGAVEGGCGIASARPGGNRITEDGRATLLQAVRRFEDAALGSAFCSKAHRFKGVAVSAWRKLRQLAETQGFEPWIPG